MLLATDRLILRAFTLADAPAVLELLNEPGFHRYIGDRGVRDVAGAESYLQTGPLASYAQHGFGLLAVTERPAGPLLGVCGLLQRDFLPHPDLGYAFLERHTGRGYAHEAAVAVLRHARETLGLRTLLALTAPENPASIKLLGKLGFVFVEFTTPPGKTEPSRLFRCDLSTPCA